MGSRGSYISFQVYQEVRVIPFVGEERRDTSGSTRSIVVRKFSQGQ